MKPGNDLAVAGFLYLPTCRSFAAWVTTTALRKCTRSFHPTLGLPRVSLELHLKFPLDSCSLRSDPPNSAPNWQFPGADPRIRAQRPQSCPEGVV
jgi:hypothetical protein